MTEHTQNIIYKWTLRARYIFVFILGAGLLSIGLESIVQPIIETNNKELQKILYKDSKKIKPTRISKNRKKVPSPYHYS